MIRAVLTKGSKLRGAARQHAEQHFLAAALRAVDQDSTRLRALWQDYASSLPDPMHSWQRIHTAGRHAAIVHADSESAADSLRHAVFELSAENTP